ncbi:hypothetical protein [Hydrogenoanaerobacterium sp.]|uniref:hypothetical protein n=1 Tax=Hydrogenoanaerobacterium sp. TaxID=2953763 RepID=UPI00289B5DC2|nr:hypothetical protein [Hydrogenoanaerobacterium sp.]
MDASQVLQQFAVLAGISQEDAQPFAPMARLCVARLYARLREDTDVDTNEEALCTVAAGMLLYQYTMTAQADTQSSFKLGDLSISAQAISRADAKALCDELLASIAPLLKYDDAFLVQVG